MLIYVIYRLAGWLVRFIPLWLGYQLAFCIGDFFYWWNRPARRAVEANLCHVLGANVPPPVLDTITRTVFRNQVCNYYDLFRIPYLDEEAILSRIEVEGWENLTSAVAHGRGAIVLSAHFGNLDVVSQILALRGYPMTVVVEHLQPEPLFQYLVRIRSRFGFRLVPADASLKPVFRALSRGELVGLVLDRDVTASGIEVPFFGRPARLPDGYARIAVRTGAPVVPAFSRRLPDQRLTVQFEPALEPPQTGDRRRDVSILMARALRVAEKHIAAHPEQWVLFCPVWSPATETSEQKDR